LKTPVHGRFANFQPESNFGNSFAVGFELPDFARVAGCARSATDPAPCPRTLQPRNSAFTKPDAFLLRNHGKDRDYGLPEHTAGIEVLLGERAVAYTVLREVLQICERFEHTLAAESV
jgi:hypothetical protein